MSPIGLFWTSNVNLEYKSVPSSLCRPNIQGAMFVRWIPRCAMPCTDVQCRAMLWNAVQCCAMLCTAVLWGFLFVLYCALLCTAVCIPTQHFFLATGCFAHPSHWPASTSSTLFFYRILPWLRHHKSARFQFLPHSWPNLVTWSDSVLSAAAHVCLL